MRSAVRPGQKALVQADQLHDQLRQRGAVDGGERDALGRPVEPRHVLVRAEEARPAVGTLVCLHAFETLEAVMEDTCGGVKGEVLVGCNARCEPSFCSGILDR